MTTNKKVSKYCSIATYLQHNDMELMNVLTDLCAAGRLNAKKNTTFLLPTGKLREQLLKDTYGGKEEEASRLIHSLILSRQNLTTPELWKKAGSVRNANNEYFTVKVVNNKITLDGIEVKPHKKFQGYANSTLSVWEIDSLPKPSTSKPKSGSYEVTTEMAKSLRYRIGIAIENKYAQRKKEMLNNIKTGSYLVFNSDEKCKCAYLETSISIQYYLLKNHYELFMNKVLPICAFQPLDFYIIVEPHTEPGSNFLVPDDIIEEWYNNQPRVSTLTAYKEILNVLSNPPQEYLKYGCYREHADIVAQVQNIRDNLLELQPGMAVKEAYKVYEKLEQANVLGELIDIYPPALHEYYKSHPGLKLVHDELRFLTTLRFDQIMNSLSADLTDYKNLINYIAETLHAPTEEIRKAQLLLMNPVSLTSNFTQYGPYFNIFIRSSYFIYMPLKLEDIKNYPAYPSDVKQPLPNDEYIWNIDAAKLSTHERIIPGFKVDDIKILEN